MTMKPSGLAVMPPPTPLAIRPSPPPRPKRALATGMTVLSPSTMGEPNTAVAFACLPIASASSASCGGMSFCKASASMSVNRPMGPSPHMLTETNSAAAFLIPFHLQFCLCQTEAGLLRSGSNSEAMRKHGDPRCRDQMGGEGKRRGIPQGPLQPGAYGKLRRRNGDSCVSLASCRGKMGGRGRRRSGGNAGRVAFELPHPFVPASGADGRLPGRVLRSPRRRRDRGNRAGTTGGDQGKAPAKDRLGRRGSREGGSRSPAPPGSRDLLHRQFGEDAGHRGIGGLRPLILGARDGPTIPQDASPPPIVRLSTGYGGQERVSTPCRCYCRSGYPLAESCDRAPSARTLEERLALAPSRRSTSGSPDPGVAPAQAC